jgi:hypothetical protein
MADCTSFDRLVTQLWPASCGQPFTLNLVIWFWSSVIAVHLFASENPCITEKDKLRKPESHEKRPLLQTEKCFVRFVSFVAGLS